VASVKFLTWFDNRTILAFETMTAAAFGLAILFIHRSYPRIRGAKIIAIAFLIAAPAMLLIAARGVIPNFISVVVANVLVYLCYLLDYLGVRRYFGQRDRALRLTAWITFVLGSGVHVYYAVIDDRIVPRIVTVCVVISVLRVIMAITLARNAHGYLHRRLFALTMTFFAILGLARIPLTLIHGAPNEFLKQNPIQTYSLLIGSFTLFIDGIFWLTLLTFEVTRRTVQRSLEDSLTGVLNRRAIEDRLNEELARGARTGCVVCAILIDIDHFKTINDTQGHAAGDAALKLVADKLSSTLRPFDTLGRFGGDEFLLILPELRLADALIRAEFLRQALAPTNSPTLSIGIAESDPGESAPSLLARADTALYRAKHAGRDCVRLDPPASPVALDKPAPRET
jgi:diguanylate cyclase (GGDEF)-like protein